MVEWERILSCYFGFLFVSLFETMFYYESLAGLRFTDICLPLSPNCWDSKRVPPCLATLGFLSPSPVLHAHHRSQTTHTDSLSWPPIPRCASPVCRLWRKERTAPLYVFLYRWRCLLAFYVFPRNCFCGAPLVFLGTAVRGLGNSPE